MAYVPMKTDELKKMVMMGKKRPMNFAYNPGPKEEDLMIIDRIKQPDVLGRIAKKEGKGTKVAAGTFELEGKKFSIKVAKELPGLAKKLRKYLKKLDFSFSIEVLDLEGAVLEADLTDEERQAQEANTPTPETPQKTVEKAAPEDDGRLTQVQDGKQPEANMPDPEPDTTVATETTTEDPEIAARRAALGTRLRGLQAPIADLGKSGVPLGKAAGAVVAQIKAGSLDTADATLTKIEAGLAKAQARKSATNDANQTDRQAAEATPAAEVENTADERAQQAEAAQDTAPDDGKAAARAKQKWEAMSGQIQTGVDTAMQANRGDLDSINRAFNFAKSQADAGEYESAIAAATNTVKLLKTAATAPANARTQEAEEGVPDNVIAYRKSRIDWSKTRTGLQAELTKLKIAIEAQTNGIEGLEEVASNTEVLFDYLDEIDASLEATLDALLATPDGPARDKLKDEAIKIVATYRATLDNDFFKSVDDNGFTNTTIRTTALTALFGVETALAA